MSTEFEQFKTTAYRRLLEIKDSDIRISTLKQGYSAIDRGIHIGGAFSSVIPMVSVFYGGFITLDVENPTAEGQDLFVLSKGHAVAAMASIYADLGYFDAAFLENSRSASSALNGHPGPTLPGVQVATGPLGQGLSVAQGFAIAGKASPAFDVYCVTGDGELQEGIVWETIMHAPQKGIDNLCVLIDKNEGQLDDSSKLMFSMEKLPSQFESFGWRVFDIDGRSYSAVTEALDKFRNSSRDGRPTAIICNSRKGYGAFNRKLNNHKVTLTEEIYKQEFVLQTSRRDSLEKEFLSFRTQLAGSSTPGILDTIDDLARGMNLIIDSESGTVIPTVSRVRHGKVPNRNTRMNFDPENLPRYDRSESLMSNKVISDCMKVFALDPHVISVDSDLSSASGLYAAIGEIDQNRALNVGIAEANMMCIGEAFAVLGFNTWVSTFCPFFNWNVMRRIAVGDQERREVIASETGWLGEGHTPDITFLATASNLDTGVNGATHMGNDDVTVFSAVAGLKIIDVSCPNQLVGIMRWIMEGGKGLIYLRIMRAASEVLYDPGTDFSYGTAVRLKGSLKSDVCLVSSGRGVHEIIKTSELLEDAGISAAIYDMPSYDATTMKDLLDSNAIIVVAEQNNGYLWNELGKMILQNGGHIDRNRIFAINTGGADGSAQYIHSATYQELLIRHGLSPRQIAEAVQASISNN